MKFAIKHPTPHHYLEKNKWNWIDELDERTVYTGEEVVRRLLNERDETLRMIEKQIQIVVVTEKSCYRETT